MPTLLFLRETLLKKGYPSDSLPKTFGCFSVLVIGHMSYNQYAIILKVFGKGFGEEPFLRKVCPEKSNVSNKVMMLFF